MRQRSLLCRIALHLSVIAAMTLLNGCGSADKAELEQLRQEHAELEKLREENAKLTEAQNSNPELVRLKKENEEVHKLRGEIRQLRDQATQLTNKAAEEARAQKAAGNAAAANQAALNQETERLRTEVARLQQMAAQQPNGFTAQQQLQGAQVMAQACVNNLRQIAGAIQQWALENKKPTGTPIGPNEIPQIAAYLKANSLPACPQGGNYSFQSVGVFPTCNIPGHVL